jgi:hypothetical protein
MNNINRRQFVSATAGMLITAPGLARASSVRLPFDNGERPLVQLPQKRPLIGLTMRPPQLETPFEIFNQGSPPMTPFSCAIICRACPPPSTPPSFA